MSCTFHAQGRHRAVTRELQQQLPCAGRAAGAKPQREAAGCSMLGTLPELVSSHTANHCQANHNQHVNGSGPRGHITTVRSLRMMHVDSSG